MAKKPMRRLFRTVRRYWSSYRRHPLRVQARLKELNARAEDLKHILSDVSWNMEAAGRFAKDPPRRDLWMNGYRVYSQQDEDGILAEVFRRLEISAGFFVEFGVQDGLCNNTLYLLAQGWRGLWMECEEGYARSIRRDFTPLIEQGQLRFREALVTAENSKELFHEQKVPRELDLLGIDIDGNDYWIWKALASYRPRVVVIEYNAGMGPTLEWVQPYDPAWTWTGSRYQGASLKALESLGRELGYALVGCNFSGVNAFFVRTDLLNDHFLGPHTAENHFRRPRYYWSLSPGHRPVPAEIRGFVTPARRASRDEIEPGARE